ncbi:YadA-like family protein [Neisseria yangbaofengii]|uniref:YadA-like family protein n=1 Tax=Neisseria yangbaofengii TaxID=2709396 RepID=UPI0013ED8461|nr:YadA-like family protein [Neisseria yangbaofengii]
MKKFNVKALSLAVAAAIASGAVGAAEQGFTGDEAKQGQAAFAAVFGKDTTYDPDAGTVTFKKDSEALLPKIMEMNQTINGFTAGKDFIAVTNADGSKVIRSATEDDATKDDFGGKGLRAAVKENSEAIKANKTDLVKTQNVLEQIIHKSAESFTEYHQDLNGFKEGDTIIVSQNGSKAFKKATEEDVKNDKFGGQGLKAVVAEHEEVLAEAKQLIVDHAEALANTAEVVNQNSELLTMTATLAAENTQEIKGFKAGDQIVATNDDGSKVVRAATEDDVKKAGFDGKGLKAVVTEHEEVLAEAKQLIVDHAEALANTAEVVNQNSELLTMTTTLAAENAQNINGFKAGDQIVTTNDDGSKVVRAATEDDVKKAGFDGKGLKAVVTEHEEVLAEAKQLIVDHAEALANTAEVVNQNSELLTKTSTLAAENAQDLNGFKAGDQIVATNDDGSKVVRAATEEDVKKAGFDGLGVKNELARISPLVSQHETALATIGKDAADAKNSAQAAEEKVTQLAANVDGKVKAAENAADKAVDAAAKIDTITGQVEQASKDVADLAVDVSKNTAALKSTAQTIGEISNDVNANTKAIATKADKADVETAQIAAVAAQKTATANAAQIVELKTTSSQHTANIAKNTARIDSLDKNVANLRKETRQGFAAQAALSGLFQPYSVGKFNVTAALGGFKSDTAVAVGAGYRFNENFAAKAGVAVGTSSGGSASYNVGLNYEW